MKSLSESLFDRDLVEKEPIDNQLKDIFVFDGQWVYRLRHGLNNVIIPTGGYDENNALGVIDWKAVKKDLKKWGGDKVNLGQYAYANADKDIMRTTETNKKSEDFARLILSIPYIEEYKFGGFNGRFRKEFTQKLNNYILPKYKVPRDKYFYFRISYGSRWGCYITLNYRGADPDPTNDPELLRWEFLKKADD